MVEFRDVVKKYAGTDEALGVPAGTVGGIPVGAAASMSPVEVVTDPDAQAALSGAFATHQDLDDAAIGNYTPEQLIAAATSPEAVAALAETFVEGETEAVGSGGGAGRNLSLAAPGAGGISSSGTGNTIGGGGTVDNPNTITTGIVNTIGGGYDHTIDATGVGANTISGGGHNAITGSADHGTIGGGSENDIEDAQYGTIAGGTNNEVSGSGTYGAILGGEGNTVTGNSGMVLGGRGNTAAGSYGIAAGLNSTAASGNVCSVAIGREVSSTGESAVALGRETIAAGLGSTALGYGARANSQGQVAQAGGYFDAPGDAQTSVQVMKDTTTDGSTKSVTGAFGPQVQSTFCYQMFVVAREPATGDSKAWKVEGVARRTGSTVEHVGGAPTPVLLGESTGASAWTLSVAAATATFVPRVTGEAGKTVRWVIRFEVTEVVGA